MNSNKLTQQHKQPYLIYSWQETLTKIIYVFTVDHHPIAINSKQQCSKVNPSITNCALLNAQIQCPQGKRAQLQKN